MVSVLMLGLACAVRAGDVRRAARARATRGAFAAALACQWVLVPAAARAVVAALDLPPMTAVACVVIACCPGGTLSNALTYFARGDLALSLARLACLADTDLAFLENAAHGLDSSFPFPRICCAQSHFFSFPAGHHDGHQHARRGHAALAPPGARRRRERRRARGPRRRRGPSPPTHASADRRSFAATRLLFTRARAWALAYFGCVFRTCFVFFVFRQAAAMMLVLIPAAIGVTLRERRPDWAALGEKIGAAVAAVVIFATVVVSFATNSEVLLDADAIPARTWGAVALMSPARRTFRRTLLSKSARCMSHHS